MYMLFTLILATQMFMSGGFALQKGQNFTEAFQGLIKGVDPTVTLCFAIVILLFYCAAVFISFRAYREFKYSFQMRGG